MARSHVHATLHCLYPRGPAHVGARQSMVRARDLALKSDEVVQDCSIGHVMYGDWKAGGDTTSRNRPRCGEGNIHLS
jgi:hypothetical protein